MKRRITLIFFLSCLMIFPFALFAQELSITGKVTSRVGGDALPGVTITVQGTNYGTSTGSSGEFQIQAASGSKIIFSQLGMKSLTITVTDNKFLNVSLEEDVSALEEVVVVGYGTQKKSNVTGAISSLKSADIENQQIGRVEQALQGRTSGVTIAASSGAPGSSSSVRVRGVTSLNSNNPLYVVDGVVVDNGGIDYLNSSDIESLEVLKDAASAAIYGARAAGGVILITTKRGKSGSLSLNYNGYYGTQSSARRLDLLNATQYATLRNEASVNGGGGILFANPESYGKGTDWQDVLFNDDARVQNHELSISGGNDKSTFYSSYGFFDQEGIVATDISNYKRNNIRLNSTHKIKNWLTVGQNLGYSHIKSQGSLGNNTEFGGPLSSAINLDPITPAVITDPAVAGAAPYSTQAVMRDANGFPYGISNLVAQEMTNPLAYVQSRLGNYNWSDNIIGNVYAEVEPIKGLKFRSTLGSKLSWWGSENFTGIYYLNPTQLSSQTAFSRGRNQGFNWNVENTISYTKSIDKHNFTVLAGQGAYTDNNTSGNNITFNNIKAKNFDEATFNLKVPVADITADAYDGVNHTVSSLFGRITYDYDEKYLFTGILRRDGSSRFGSNNKYGVFPSASVGWNISNEDFWSDIKAVNVLKLRASYGIVGNDELGDFRYISTVGSGRNYVFGYDNLYIGYSPDAPANPDLKWEETSQLNIGIDAVLFQDWNLTLDWFNKKTSGILRTIPLPSYIGATGSPWGNVADMENTGVEVGLGYRKRLGNFNLNVNGNISYLKNEVTYLGTDIDFIGGAGGIQNMSDLQRTAIGQAYNSFYGYQTAGIFQNQEEINAYVDAAGTIIQPTALPGDFRWVDINNDGKINSDDRKFLGSPIPDWSYGLTFNSSYKAFDLLLFGQGVIGNKIFQGLRRLDVTTANWPTKALDRWVGEGTSNIYPRISTSDNNHNFSNASDFYLEDGSYFRIKTLQLGYTIPRAVISKAALQKVRVYLSSNNLITFTKYTGFDPEIGGGSDVWGIDAGIYPQARTFSFGVNIGL